MEENKIDMNEIPDFLRRTEPPTAAVEDVDMPEDVTSIYVSPEIEGGTPVPEISAEPFPEAVEAAGAGWIPNDGNTAREIK